MLQSWGWTQKKKQRKQINKFKIPNLTYYSVFLHEVKKIPFSKLKFIDESRFNSRDIRRDYVYGPSGERVDCVDTEPLTGGLSYTMILMTSLNTKSAPFRFTIKPGTNSQVDFLEFFMYLCEKGYLETGDVLVMDNCSIHVADDTFAEFVGVADAAGVKLVFLPKYSPELNPCETVFSKLKNFLRANRLNAPWDEEIMFSLSLVSVYDVFHMYMACVWLDFETSTK